MRSHGVPAFPDPNSASSSGTGDSGLGIDGYTFNVPAYVNPQAPAFASAQKACSGLLGGGGSGSGPPPGAVARARRAAVAHAQCMREHGVPDFPDPRFSGSAEGITVSSGAPGMNPQSPAFQRAQKDCQGPS